MSDFAYVNLTMAYTGSDPNGNMLASTNVQYNTPVISKPSDYYLFVQRFVIDGGEVPLLVPLVQTGNGQTDINKLVYQFAIGYTSPDGEIISDAINVSYVPSNATSRVPIAPSGGIQSQDLSSNYYYIYTYSEFLTMWNTALEDALVNLGTKGVDISLIKPPVFYFDTSLGVVLKAKTDQYKKTLGVTSDNDVGFFQIYFNSQVSSYVTGLPSAYIPNPSGCNNVFYLYDQINNLNVDGSYYLQSMQNIQELSFWTTATNYQILSNIGIVKEYSQGILGSNSTQQSQQNAILTDFSPDTSNDVGYHTKLVYNKTDSLRMIELMSDTPIYNVSASVYFVDNFGRSYPLYIGINSIVSIKFGFIKKDVYRALR